MGVKDIDTDHLTITGAHKDGQSHVEIKDDVLIIVTQAYGPKGDNLVGISDVKFDGFDALTLKLRAGEVEGLVHLSPFHGDRRKEGLSDIPVGTKCELLCPVSDEPLNHLGKVNEKGEADYFVLYLTPRLDGGEVVAISDIWGDYHSRIVDNAEIISTWANQEEGV
jgi:hypothetical protein